MKLSRKWLMVIAMLVSLTVVTTGTLAYLTDTDTKVNTFTVGNVDIEVEEEFVPDSPLIPGVDVEKQAGVENTHESSSAWVWMTVSVPENLDEYIELNWMEGTTVIELEESNHEGCVSYLVLHPEILGPGETTPMYLQSVTMSELVDYQNGQYVAVENGNVTEIGELTTVDVIVDGYAIQVEGFDTVEEAYEAYTAQWGVLNGGESGEQEPVGNAITNEAELAQALVTGGSYYFANDIDVTSTLPVSSDVTIDLNGFDLDASGNASRPFEMGDGSSITIEGGDSIINIGAYGLVNIPADSDAQVTLNGGNYTGEPDNGAFIKVRGTGEVAIELNNVNYSDTSNQSSWIVDDINYMGNSITVNVQGGEYVAAQGFAATSGPLTLQDVDLTVTGSGTTYAVVTYVSATIDGCTINSNGRAVAAANMAEITASNSTIIATGGHALYIMTSGGTIETTGCTISGAATPGNPNWYASGQNNGAVAIIIVDGETVVNKN